MKPLLPSLLTLSLLLLTSPLFGQETGVLYQYETSSGLVWKSVGSKKLQPKYEGDVENGVPNGLGVLISTNGWKYFGSWKSGEIWNGTEYDNYGNIIYRWVNGKRKYHNLYKTN